MPESPCPVATGLLLSYRYKVSDASSWRSAKLNDEHRWNDVYVLGEAN
jgi:hypothetical protein